MELLKLLQVRRSIRKYKDEAIPEDKLMSIVRAGLLAPSSRGIYPVEFVIVRKTRSSAVFMVTPRMGRVS